MSWILYFTSALILIWAAYLIYIQSSDPKPVALSAKPLADIFPDISGQEAALVYCYSHNCPPCKRMAPIIDALLDEGHPVYKMDINEYMEIARNLKLRGTPCTLTINKGTITYILLGFKSKTVLEQYLTMRAESPA